MINLEYRHHEGEDEEGEPAGDEGARDDGQRLGRLPLPLRLQTHVLLLLRPAPPGDRTPAFRGYLGLLNNEY